MITRRQVYNYLHINRSV